MEAAMALAKKLGSSETSMAISLAKQTINAAAGTGDNSGSLRMERVTEGLLYELKRKPRAVIEGVGLAAPDEVYTQEQVADLLKIKDPRIRGLFASGGHIATRCLAEMEAEQKMDASEVTQGYLTKKHVKWAKIMAGNAIPAACASAGVQMSEIEFIVVCTTTGFVSPGLSAHVVQHLGLSQFVQRVDIVGMGCHAGLNTMFTAAHWAEAHPGAVALMFCVEVVSAAYMWDPSNPDISEALTNSLFGDGSAAAVLRCPVPDPMPAPKSATPVLRPSLWGFESMILPDSLETLCYFWDDARHKNSFIIQPQVPYVMGITIPQMIERLLNRFKIKRSQVAHWIAHSGGKKVLDSAMYALGLEKFHFRHSVNSLRKMGNMSSGSFLWSYHSLLEEGNCNTGDFGVFLTMGPGAGLECALWRFE